MIINYNPYPTARKFHSEYNEYNFRYIAGPPGSGKSVSCFMDLMAIALRQEPTPEGVRPTRFGIIRSTYGELEGTTLETMKHWLPREYTHIVHSKPIKVHTNFKLPDKTTVDIHFVLIAIANNDDLSKLDSAEFTAIWINEMTGVPPALVGKAGERVGRYPPSNMWRDGRNHCTYRGVIGDYNYPPLDHWLVNFLHQGSDKLPDDTMLYEQPPALLELVDPDTGATSYEVNPKAENLVNLDNGNKYLQDLSNYLKLGEKDLINTRLLCRYGAAGGDGKPIINNFDRDFHVAEQVYVPFEMTDTLISIDTSGIHPCALLWQYVRGEWRVTDGIYGDEMGFIEFVDDVLIPLLTMQYPMCNTLAVCDPANARDSFTATTPIELLKERGIRAIPASTNKFKSRVDATEVLLSRREKGCVKISPKINMLIDALGGAYQYKKLKATGINTVFSTQPDKNKYSHWADAFQYGALHITNDTMSDEQIIMARRLAAASVRRGRL